jgi:hypothetical protein
MNTFRSSSYHIRSDYQDLQLHRASDAPWIPLDDVLAQWAAFGKEASSAEQIEAVSHAFAALAFERQALHATAPFTQAHHRIYQRQCSHWNDLIREKTPIIAFLQQAADQWYVAISLLLASSEEAAPLQGNQQPGEQIVSTLIGLALEQRLRVWSIAQCLLLEQTTGYRQAMESAPLTSIGVSPDQQREEVGQ